MNDDDVVEVRDVVRLYAGTKEGRTGVVMRVFVDLRRAIVLFGTSSYYAHEPHVAVASRERAGIALGLTSPTTYFFQRSGFARPPFDALQPLGRKCPPELFLKLEEADRPGGPRSPIVAVMGRLSRPRVHLLDLG
jgi:hypothetical protein